MIGASAGGVKALLGLAGSLPADLAASVFVSLHMYPGAASTLPELMSARGPLRAIHAVHGEPIERGRIYVSPVDNHLMLRPGYLHVVRGPKENGHRPAVDALFRSAARAYGGRVIGVVLTGFGDCGTAGLLSIKARGGLAVVQDPASADAPDMPRSATRHVEVDHVVQLAQLPGLLARLCAEPAGPESVPAMHDLKELEGDEPGGAAELVCPLCQGVLTTAGRDGFTSMRCHVGHAFSLDSLAAEQADSAERALWSAVRALEESAALAGRMANSANGHLGRRFADRQEAQLGYADRIRNILLSGGMASRADTPAPQEATD